MKKLDSHWVLQFNNVCRVFYYLNGHNGIYLQDFPTKKVLNLMEIGVNLLVLLHKYIRLFFS